MHAQVLYSLCEDDVQVSYKMGSEALGHCCRRKIPRSTFATIRQRAMKLAFGDAESDMALLNSLEEVVRDAGHFMIVHRFTAEEFAVQLASDEKEEHEKTQKSKKAKNEPIGPRFDFNAVKDRFVG